MTRKIILSLLTLTLIGGCGKKRPTKRVPSDNFRIHKLNFKGEFYFLKSIVNIETPGNGIGQYLFPGVSLESGQVVKFNITEHHLNIVTTSNPLSSSSPREQSGLLASFPISHVDVTWAKNADNEDTRTEEVTTSRNPWQKRSYIVISTESDQLDSLGTEYAILSNAENGIEIDKDTGAINFKVSKVLNDGTVLTERYSLLPKTTKSSYTPLSYSLPEKKTYGYFDTVTYSFDEHGRVTQDSIKRYANRWDTSKTITYYLSPNFPEHLISEVQAVFTQWNKAFSSSTGSDFLTLERNSGQEIGDMRYNMIVYIDDSSSSSILGYGPTYTDPKTGQILKGDVYLYGSTLKRSIYSERQWLDNISETAARNSASFNMNTQNYFNRVNPSSLLLTDIKKVTKKYALQEDLLKNLQKKYKNWEGELKKLRTPKMRDFKRTTMLDENIVSSMLQQRLAEDLTDEELEIKIFGPLLAHELGHNFGLRHNFMASADKDNFGTNSQTSSVMDYTFLSSKDANGPGKYDQAALDFAYGDKTKKEASLKKNFYYCTDEDLFSSRLPMCAQFDSGTDLEEIAKKQFTRYQTSYLFNNIRGDRAFFWNNPGAYINSLFRYLMPLRLTIDNANAIIEMVNTSYTPGESSETVVFRSLWELLGKRIESDSSTLSANEVSIEVSSGVTKKFDLAKIQAISTEAKNARDYGVSALIATVTETVRPNYSSVDPVTRQLATRGVLLDKLIALIILAQDTPDPLGRGYLTSALTNNEEAIGDLFTQIIANSRFSGSQIQFSIWDINIRSLALSLLQDLTRPGKQTSEMVDILKIDEDPAVDADVTAYKAENTTIITELINSLASTATQTDIDNANAAITAATTTRNALDIGVANIKGKDYKASIPLTVGDLSLTSATGVLLRESISDFDNLVAAYTQAITNVGTDIANEAAGANDATKMANLLLLQNNYKQALRVYRRFTNQEKSFIEEIYAIYHPNR